MNRQEVAEILAGAEELQEFFERSGPAFDQRRQLLRAGGVAQETLQAVEGHIRVGTTGKEPAQWWQEIAQLFRSQGPGQAGQVVKAPLRIAQIPFLKQPSRFLGRFQTRTDFFNMHSL